VEDGVAEPISYWVGSALGDDLADRLRAALALSPLIASVGRRRPAH